QGVGGAGQGRSPTGALVGRRAAPPRGGAAALASMAASPVGPMRRLRTLDRHVGLTLVRQYLIALGALVAVFTIFAFVEELDDLGKGHYRLKAAVFYTLLTTPRRAIDVAPVTALLASLTALGTLASGRELVAMQAAGISPLRIAGSTPP